MQIASYTPYAMPNIFAFREENFGEENFDESLSIHQVHQDFSLQSLVLYGILDHKRPNVEQYFCWPGYFTIITINTQKITHFKMAHVNKFE